MAGLDRRFGVSSTEMIRSSVLIVAYGIESLDLAWVPPTVEVLIVHNDDRLDRAACVHPNVRHLGSGHNIGFGAAMNVALAETHTERVILCNPDTRLDRQHFDALDSGDDSTVLAIPLVEADGTPNAVVNPYWSVAAFVATAFRLGRYVPRGGRYRKLATRLLGRNGAAHVEALGQAPGRWPLTERWVSGAVLSLPTAAMRAVGGFDEDYFLYFEDADIQQRLATARPDLWVELKDVEPATHLVGGSGNASNSAAVAGHRYDSARTYASRQEGIGWRLTEAALAVGAR